MKDATSDPQVIEMWRQAYPETNWGLATGAKSGVWVLDIDPKHGGFASLEQLGQMPPTVTVASGGGGRHYYFRSDPAVRNRVDVLPGIDARSDGGYVILPGGRHISGGLYSWENEGAEVLSAPQSVVAAIASRPSSSGSNDALRDTQTILSGVPEGARDTTLFKWACRLRRLHETDADGGRAAVTALVLQAARNSTPPFPESEARAKIEQAFKQDHGVPDGEPSSWQPIDLGPILRGEYQPPLPTLMRRTDGVAMLYPGLVHSFYGAPESGKSFAAQGASAQVLTGGGRVLPRLRDGRGDGRRATDDDACRPR